MTGGQVSWLMDAPSAEPRMPRGAIGGPAYFASKRRAHTSGCVTTTEPTRNCDGLAQAETRQAFQERLLQARRLALIGTLRHLRAKHRSTCDAMADLKAVTLALLAQGDRA